MNAILNYFRGAVQELHNVTWPTHRQAAILAVGVLAFVVVAAAIIGGVDYLLFLGFNALRTLAL